MKTFNMWFYGHWRLPGMDYLGLLLVVMLGHLSKVTGVCRCRCAVQCPPTFPDFEQIFHRTLNVQPWLRMRLEEMKITNWQTPCCTYSPSLMGNMSQFNKYRCMRASELDMQCYTTTSTTTTTSPTSSSTSSSSLSRSTDQPETSIRTSKPYWTSNLPSSSRGEKTTEPTFFTSVVVTIPSPSSSLKPDVPVGPNTVEPPVSPVTGASHQVDKRTVAIACAAVGALLLIVIIIGLICRSRSCVGAGAVGRRAKVQRQRSDLRPITSSSTPTSDMCDSVPPTPTTPNPNVINHRIVSNGLKWRPQVETSDAGSVDASIHSQDGNKYVLLREDSNTSALSHHYSTLNAIDHPHALSMGGFGESSTDQTMPRPRGLESFKIDETQFAVPTVKGKDSHYIQNEKKAVDKNRNKLVHSSPSFLSHDSGHGSSESDPPSVEGDRNSLADDDCSGGQGINNPVFETDEDFNINNNAQYTELVTGKTSYDVIHSDTQVYPTSGPVKSSEDLQVPRYDPTSQESLQSTKSVIEPPLEFRDSENRLAVVKPSVVKENGGHLWSKNGVKPQSDLSKGPHIVTISMDGDSKRPSLMVKPNSNRHVNGHSPAQHNLPASSVASAGQNPSHPKYDLHI